MNSNQQPVRSSDLTAPDFFLWGYLKQEMYSHNIENIETLKQCIRAEIDIINRDKDLFKRVYESMIHRFDACSKNNGQYIDLQ